jgi:hypothetical protein
MTSKMKRATNLAEMLRKTVNENRETRGAVNERDGSEYVWVKYDTSDGWRMMWLDERLEERLRDSINNNFVDFVVGFVPKFYDGHITNYEPVFVEEKQREWDRDVNEYHRAAFAYYANKRPGEYCGD